MSKQCLQISFFVKLTKNFMKDVVQENAVKFDLEGTAQVVSENEVKIVACGKKDLMDKFIDALHTFSKKYDIENIELEPFIKTKDYRGVFRVIE